MIKFILLICFCFIVFAAAQQCSSASDCATASPECDPNDDCGVCSCVNNACVRTATKPTGQPCSLPGVGDGLCLNGNCNDDYCYIGSTPCSMGLLGGNTFCADPAEYTFGAGVLCRPKDGPCDRADYCDGVSPFCPNDRFLNAGTICRTQTGCDDAGYCDGTSSDCPPSEIAVGASCDDGIDCTTGDECTEAGECDGTPSDQLCDDGNQCTDDSCSATGGCIHARISGSCDCEAPPGSNPTCYSCLCEIGQCVLVPKRDVTRCLDGFSCTAMDTCDGNGFCVGIPTDEICGVEPDDCQDLICDPNDARADSDGCVRGPKPAGTQCRAANGVCDIAENCDGASLSCPPDSFLPSTTVCRTGSGDECDKDEYCPGSSAGPCPHDDASSNAGITCRQGQGHPNGGSECDPKEVCTGIAGVPCPPQQCNVGQICRPTTGECDVAETCPNSQQACNDGDPFVCPPNHYKPHGTPCGVDDGNSCTVQACTGYSSICATTTLPDNTQCEAACGTGSCQAGVCQCSCELECVLTRGAVERNSPGAKGKARDDPVWQTDLFQNTEVCGLTLDDFFNNKNTLPSGCENDLLAQYYTVLYNIERYKLSTGLQCSSPADEADVTTVLDYVKSLLPLSCHNLNVPDCAAKVLILSNFNEGNGTVDHCSSSLPIQLAVSSQPPKDKGIPSDDNDGLGAGGIVAIVFGSLTGLILIGLCVFIMFGAWGNMSNGSSNKKSKGYRRQREDGL